ncbi:MAG: helix-turn-helix domain-containing protein [Akkermansiaceae bacterium]|nr:helix-turn-helix domain-containing protein [Akkermansiaceae bacterium]
MAEFDNLEYLHDLCRLRSTLEAFAAARLHNHPSYEDIQGNFRIHLATMKQHAFQGNYGAFHEEDMRLHRTLVASVGIPTLLSGWEYVVADLEAWIRHVKKAYWPSLMTLYREHEILIEAWGAAESWVAEQATHHHLEAGWFRVASAQGKVKQDIHPVDKATSFICTHYASDIDVEWLAQNVSFVSASHLTRLFREQQGISPYAFLKQVRMERAAELLRSTSDSIALISRRVGYKTSSHFARDFLKTFQTNPRAFRK